MLKTLTRLVYGCAVTTVFSSVSGLVLAQEAPAQGRKIEEVIVTAERKEASVQDTSISITAFTEDFLADFGIRNQEDVQNFVPATTIQPYDATIRGVGRNFRALGGDPGVATYINGVYSEDLLTATAATFWDVQRIEVLRGPQGTLYGRNAVGGAINILYEPPTNEFQGAVKGILGDYGTKELYGMLSGPIIKDQLMARVNFAHRDRDGVIDEIGEGPDLDGLGTDNFAVLLKWRPTDTLELNIRHNWMDIDRVFGGANGGGLVVLNEESMPTRVTDTLVPGYRRIDTANTDPDNFFDNDFYDSSQSIITYQDPVTGADVLTQRNRPGIDYGDFDGFTNAAASLDGFNETSPESAARYNDCVFPGKIKGDDVCAATNGYNWESFEQQGTQFDVEWAITETFELKYIYGHNDLTYQRITDDDNTGSLFHDRQFYVNHEAVYDSHELQAFYDFGERMTFTSGIFFYDATIDQRGDFYSSIEERRYKDAYQDNTAMSQAAAEAFATDEETGVVDQDLADAVVGLSASDFAFAGRPMATLFSARNLCTEYGGSADCPRNATFNVYTSAWYGDPGTDRALDVIHGPRTVATDLLYTTQTKRKAFAAYTQGVFDLSKALTLTLGIRYAEDKLKAEENLFRYSETGGAGFLALYGGLAAVNQVNGGLVDDGNGNLVVPTDIVTNGGIPYALSVYRPFKRKDDKITWRVNLDWDVTDSAMMYFNVTTGYRSGGYSLVYFSQTPTYDPEDLTAYEIGYKTQWLDDRLQVNGSFYYYDYDNIHTFATEVSAIGGTSTSVLAAPGAEIYGIEAEATWLITDRISLGGNFSYTPSKYTKDFYLKDPADPEHPIDVFPEYEEQVQNIKGNQLLQVPEGKATAWGSYRFPLSGGASLELFGMYSWISKVYYSPFESNAEVADAYDRVDLSATFRTASGNLAVRGFVNNVLNDVGVLQILREGEDEFYRHSAGTTVPRHYGLEVTYNFGAF